MGELRKDGRPRKVRWDGLTGAVRTRFLEGLAATCHVGRSVRLAGKKDPANFYRLRNLDPEFAAAWDEAIGTARARIEAGLMAKALVLIEAQGSGTEGETEGGDTGDGAPALGPLDFDKVMQLLKYYRTAPADRAKPGPKRRYATAEETDAALMKRLDVVEARVRAREARERAEKRAAKAAAKLEAEGKGGSA